MMFGKWRRRAMRAEHQVAVLRTDLAAAGQRLEAAEAERDKWKRERDASTAATPSRDNQELRHCEKAPMARSGRPRWRVEEMRPIVTSKSAKAIATKSTNGELGVRPRAYATDNQNIRP